MEMVTEIPALTELVVTLEQATLMAKQLPNTTDPSQIIQIYATLHSAHHQLSSFLSQTAQHPHPLPQPSLPLAPTPLPAAENSLSSAFGNGMGNDDDEDEPMQDGNEEEEQNLKTTIERVEERMRDCFIQNKRPKRPLSPSSAAAAEHRRSYEQELVGDSLGFDPRGTRLRALDLIYQFHG